MLVVTASETIVKARQQRGTITAHVIRLSDPAAAGGFSYNIALSFGTGEPIGFIATRGKDVLKVWRRLASVEEWLSIFGNMLISFTVVPDTCPEQGMIDMLFKQYKVLEHSEHDLLNIERKRLIAAFNRGADPSNGRSQGSPDTTDA
ncbi:hypothetical protein D2T29_12870 [Sinirhodobacter populi]|uniref:Uncharacterized protein n=1 Tax=Paenirhodobacter populi TaxID=2306993 RepID=A0A443KCP1_9RHOB|nr:hypothetical protein [Sinirhodobacter populi]RWR30558.1 hypothetical protein D2T29_12870 [Sinirhodobacter populi]